MRANRSGLPNWLKPAASPRRIRALRGTMPDLLLQRLITKPLRSLAVLAVVVAIFAPVPSAPAAADHPPSTTRERSIVGSWRTWRTIIAWTIVVGVVGVDRGTEPAQRLLVEAWQRCPAQTVVDDQPNRVGTEINDGHVRVGVRGDGV